MKKKEIKKINNAVLALLVLFVVPVTWNVLMGILGENTTLSSCWNNATPSFSHTYIEDERERTNVFDTGEYENGKKQETTTSSNSNASPDNYKNKLANMQTPTKQQIEEKAKSLGMTSEYAVIIIGTTQREGYVNDPYLYYGWASAMINNRVSLSQMQGWDPYNSGDANYYSWTNIQNGYNNVSSDVLKSVYLALTERNTKIVECNGMYKTTPSGYNLLYKSSVYNCSIYETK